MENFLDCLWGSGNRERSFGWRPVELRRRFQHSLNIRRLPSVRGEKVHSLGRTKLEGGSSLAQLLAGSCAASIGVGQGSQVDDPGLKAVLGKHRSASQGGHFLG